MSMYGDDDYYCSQKNEIYYAIISFLKNHPISELLNIIADVVEEKELSF